MMNSRIRNKQNPRMHGVTLLELVMVLVVAAIVVSWAFPWLTQSIQNNQMASQNMSLVSMLSLTKNEAIRRNAEVSMVLSSSGGGWSAIIEDPSNEADIEGCVEGQLRCSSNQNASLTICDEGLGDCSSSHTVVFNNRGYIIDPDDPTVWAVTTLFLQHNSCTGQSQRSRVDILPSGQISTCNLPCDSIAACP